VGIIGIGRARSQASARGCVLHPQRRGAWGRRRDEPPGRRFGTGEKVGPISWPTAASISRMAPEPEDGGGGCARDEQRQPSCLPQQPTGFAPPLSPVAGASPPPSFSCILSPPPLANKRSHDWGTFSPRACDDVDLGFSPASTRARK
jgi:hypothetical protein